MNSLIHHAMLAAANNQPDSHAVELEDRHLTYRELDTGSAVIAATLLPLLKEKEECVAIFMEKSIESILAMYGILRAGAAYVPLDTKSPNSRTQYIVEQCGITKIITTPNDTDKLSALLSQQNKSFEFIILADDSWPHPAEEHSYYQVNTFTSLATGQSILPKIKDAPLNSDHLAAVLYTSGSTGSPKGVMITHDNVTVFTAWAINYFQLGSNDRLASHAPLHFDLSLLDIFAAHKAGAPSVLIPEAMAGNPKYLSQFITEKKITLWQSVPTALSLVLKYGNLASHQYKNQYNHLRHVLFAGERMSTQNVQGLAAYFKSAIFHNIYGATETNDTFVFSIADTSKILPDPLPIGRPLPYVEYMIDKGNKHNPGNEGELLVKTPTLMRGYRCQPRLNSAIDKPAFYRTSDIVKVLSNGELQFVGRTDDIVKTNGYRVNLLAIESVLQQHESIQEVAVIAIPDDEIGNKIIAIVAIKSTTKATTKATAITDSLKINAIALRVFCSEHLPKYSIPHIFEIHTQPLPKTSSGKTNKKLLTTSRLTHVEYS